MACVDSNQFALDLCLAERVTLAVFSHTMKDST